MPLTTKQLATVHPVAFAALPSPFQNDSCLVFFHDVHGNLIAAPKAHERAILGDWEAVFDAASGSWMLGSVTFAE